MLTARTVEVSQPRHVPQSLCCHSIHAQRAQWVTLSRDKVLMSQTKNWTHILTYNAPFMAKFPVLELNFSRTELSACITIFALFSCVKFVSL